MLINFIISELIKLKKNYGLFIYIFSFLIIFIILSFTLHLSRWGTSGNANVPLNITYSGYIFYYGFFLSLIIFCLLIDNEVRNEITSGRIFFILTQKINRTEYFIGKTLYWFIIFSIFTFFIAFLSYTFANIIFSGKVPLLLNDNVISKSTIKLNLFINILFLFPVIYIFISMSFFTGFVFKLPSTGIVLYLLIGAIGLFTKIFYSIIPPFKMIRIYNNTLTKIHFFSRSIFIYLILSISFLLILYFIFLHIIKKREI